MSYDVNPILIVTNGDTSFYEAPNGHHVVNIKDISTTRIRIFPHEPVLSQSLLSNVKIKRPDGTWAQVLQVTEVHMKLPDGSWQVFT